MSTTTNSTDHPNDVKIFFICLALLGILLVGLLVISYDSFDRRGVVQIKSVQTTPIVASSLSEFSAADFNFTFGITKPVSGPILYEFDSVLLLYKDILISNAEVGVIVQNLNELQSTSEARFLVKVDDQLYDSMLSKIQDYGGVMLLVKMTGLVTVRQRREYPDDWTERKRSFRVDCSDVRIVFPSDSIGKLWQPIWCFFEFDNTNLP